MTIHRRLMLGIATLALAAPALGQSLDPRTLRGDPIPELSRASHIVMPQTRCFSWTAPTAVPGIVIESVEADVKIIERTARTNLTIHLRNTARTQEEGVVLLPVPDGAVVSSFSFDGLSQGAQAQVLPRDEARRVYDAIVRKLLDPALLEFAGWNLIRSSVFPVPPGGTQTVQLAYEHLLEADGNRVDYVLPRSESLEGRRPWRVTVDVSARMPISSVYSPSHSLVEERKSNTRFHVRLADDATLEPGSFRLSYLLDGGGVSASLFAYPDPEVGGGFFLLMAGLPADVEKQAAQIKREVTLVIDRSGSMAGLKLDQVKAAALQVIEGLRDGEAFNIIDYSSSVATFAAAPVVRSEQSALDARAYLAAIRPSGGTNIFDALAKALEPEPTEGMLPIVLFLTDGLPTIGRTSEIEIRNLVESGNGHGRRVFTFGVGQDVNVPLLDRMADITRATATYVMPDENVEVKVAQVFRRLYGPVFADIALATTDSSGTASTRLVSELIPEHLPDLYEGHQLILLGQYRDQEKVTFTFSGNYLGEPRSFDYSFAFGRADASNAFVPRLWASRRIAFLIDEIRQAGAIASLQPAAIGTSMLNDPRYQEIVDEILRLSTKYGILTEYTAFLAREGTDLADRGAIRAGCTTNLDNWAVKRRSGEQAVAQALNFNTRKGQAWLNIGNKFIDQQSNQVECTSVQQVRDRAFFKRGKRWIDSSLLDRLETAQPVEVIMIGTPEHQALLELLVRQRRQGVISLKGEILLNVNGRTVLVTDGC